MSRQLTPHDHKMIAVAARRGLIRLDDGTLCQLVAWRPSRNRGYCRVQFQTGGRATLRVERVMELVDA